MIYILTSIIILTKNQLDYTKACLESIRTYTNTENYELIIVDNASDDGTREWLQQQPDVRLILNDENKGFPAGCNQGIEIATGDNILLLNNDVVVTHNWLANLVTCLYSAEDIGAVGPVTNNASYYTAIPVDYTNLTEMQKFAKDYNQCDANKWEQRVILIGFCMLIKKSVVEKIGLLDEIFTPGNYEDDDYSYRMQLAGYRLMICKDTFVHHYGSVSFAASRSINHTTLLAVNSKKFERKWGFNSHYSSSIRFDVLSLLDEEKDAKINVLEVGCAAGATLLEIKNRYKNANVYGIEINEKSAAVAQKFMDVTADNIEKDINYPKNFFDYILFGDVLEHLYDPWAVLDNLRKYLKSDGRVLISIPNVMHYSVLSQLLNGHWEYQDSGLLDRTHLRFFTLKELQVMLENAYYTDINFSSKLTNREIDKVEEDFIDQLATISNPSFKEQYKAYQYLISATKESDTKVAALKQVACEAENIELNISTELAIDTIIEIFNKHSEFRIELLNSIIIKCINPVKVLQQLGVKSFEKNQNIEIIFGFLYSAFELNPDEIDTIYNIAYILSQFNLYEEAMQYVNRVTELDKELDLLKNYISHQLQQSKI